MVSKRKSTPYKLAILTNMVAPYRVSFFNALSQSEAVDELTILTCVDREIDRKWKVESSDRFKIKRLSGITLNLKNGADAKRILHFKFGIFLYLMLNRPGKLIIGDASWTSYMAVLACKLFFIEYLVWSEITTSSKVSNGLTAKLRRWMYRSAEKIIASCEMAKDFLLLNGVESTKISIVNNAVDNDFYLRQKEINKPKRKSLRSELKVAEDAFCFIYVGQLISRKRVLETVSLLADASKERSIHLIVAGSGPLEDEMKILAVDKKFDAVSFCGYTDPKRLCQLYTASDGLILLSVDEPWGMVVNEALLMGIPYFVSDSVAAGVELKNQFPGVKVTMFQKNELARNLLEFVDKKTSIPKLELTPVEMANGFALCL